MYFKGERNEKYVDAVFFLNSELLSLKTVSRGCFRRLRNKAWLLVAPIKSYGRKYVDYSLGYGHL